MDHLQAVAAWHHMPRLWEQRGLGTQAARDAQALAVQGTQDVRQELHRQDRHHHARLQAAGVPLVHCYIPLHHEPQGHQRDETAPRARHRLQERLAHGAPHTQGHGDAASDVPRPPSRQMKHMLEAKSGTSTRPSVCVRAAVPSARARLWA